MKNSTTLKTNNDKNKIQKTDEEFKLDDYLPFQFFIISAMMCRKLKEIYVNFGIDNNKEWRVMAFLHENGRLSMSDISAMSFIDPVNLTRAVENLFQKGYCERYYDTKDRRKVEVALSEEGIKVMKKLIPELKTWEEKFSSIVGFNGSKKLSKNFKKITNLLSESEKVGVNYIN